MDEKKPKTPGEGGSGPHKQPTQKDRPRKRRPREDRPQGDRPRESRPHRDPSQPERPHRDPSQSAHPHQAPAQPDHPRKDPPHRDPVQPERPHREPSAQAPAQPEPPRKEPPRRRRRKKKRLTVLGVMLYLIFVIGVSTLLAALGWVWANDVLALNKPAHTAVIALPDEAFTTHEEKQTDEDGKTTTKTVSEADMDYVADLLHQEGIIEYKTIFRLFAAFSHAEQKLAPGTYQLNTDMDYRAIVSSMSARSASRVEVRVTIPEGYTLEQTFRLLEEKGVSTVAKLTDQAATYDYKFSFLAGIPLGQPTRLEGYLFPDTYDFYLGEDPKTVINKLLANFDRRLNDELRADIEQSGYTLHEIVTIASLIEKETDGTDQTHISSVIYNRLTTDVTGGKLEIDATVQYALPERKEHLSYADLEIDSPYNTYKYAGLPAGPIANPGIAAIRAAVYPEKTKDYWYMLGSDGVHHFFSNYNKFVQFKESQGS